MMRKKWLREKYREETMAKAIAITGRAWLGGPTRQYSNGLGKPDVSSNGKFAQRPSTWPAPLQPEAYHGVAGELVHAIEPHTEADPAGLLMQLLVAFGNLVGRSAYFPAGADQHYTNEFTVMVGPS